MLGIRTGWALIGLLALAAGCDSPAPQPENPAVASALAPSAEPAVAAPAPAGALTRVDSSLVCMVNNQFMGKPQIPVEVAGRTYYGCCPMCKGKLESTASARSATDPVTQRPVDKAAAVIGKAADNSVVYFESEQTFASYVARKQ